MSVRLRLSLDRALHAAGEPIEVQILLQNQGQRPLAVHPLSDRDNPQLGFHITGGAAPIDLSATTVPEGGTIDLPPQGIEIGYVSLGRRAALAPGDYTVVARFAAAGVVAESEPLAFSVFAPERRLVALPAARHPALPASARLSVALAGAKAGLVMTHRLPPGLEHEGHYEITPAMYRATAPRPPRDLLAVAAREGDQLDWDVWSDAAGLVARAGDAAVQGLWELPLQEPFVPLSPALQQADGSLVVYAAQGRDHEIVECRFSPPVTIVEQPRGPDDWDDEALVAGAAKARSLGTLGLDVTSGAACESGTSARLVLASAGKAGITLRHVEAGESLGRGDSVLFAEARSLPDARPIVSVAANGKSVARVLFWRPRMIEGEEGKPVEDAKVQEIFVGTALFGGEGPAETMERSLGMLPRPVRSAALAASWLATEPDHFRVAILDGAGWLHLGDGSRGLEIVQGVSPLVIPLVLGTTAARAYLCVDTSNGPLPFAIAP